MQDDLGAAAQKAGPPRSRPTRVPKPATSIRSDHFPFAKVGVPSISLKSGEDLYTGGTAAGSKAEEEFTDKSTTSMATNGPRIGISAASPSTSACSTTSAVTWPTRRRWPDWKADSEFKTTRDKTKSARKP